MPKLIYIIKNKNLLISYIAYAIFTIYSQTANAQLYDNDQAPSSVRWKQINTNNFQLIFPAEFEKTATLLAPQIDSMIYFSSQDLAIKPKKISIIFQENHLIQNGYAQLAPRKIEVYSTPGPSSDNTEWLPNLIQHELRHIAQFDKLTGNIKGPFFEQLALALYGLHVPAWYFEGDAVAIETAYSSGGRGRIPSWIMPLRTNILSKKNYSFNKNILGSFKDITSSYYLTGYVMNNYLSNQYGPDIKEKILEDMRGQLWRPFNFNSALKKHTSLSIKELYNASISQVDSIWNTEPKAHVPDLIFSTKNKFPTNYLLPQSNSSNEIFTLFQSPETTPKIIRIKDNKKETVVKIGPQLTPYFHLNNDYLVWDELRKDSRFGKQTYNVIQILDLKTKKTRSLSKKSRYYSPILTSNSDKVYFIQVDQDNLSSLSKLDILSRKSEKLIEMPIGIHLQQPSLNADESKIVAIAISKKGTNIIEFDLNSLSWEVLLAWSNQQYERPIYQGNNIIFKAHFNHIDNLYKLSVKDSSLTQLTDSRSGAFYPSLENQSNLLYNDYQHNGYKITRLKLDQLEFTPVNFEFKTPKLLDKTNPSSDNRLPIDSLHAIAVENYNPLSDLLNFHSLSVSANNFENFNNYKPGIYWMANDLLNTSQIKLGYQYDLEIEKSTFLAELIYQKYFPKFIASYQNRGQIGYAKKVNSPSEVTKFDFREHYYSFQMQIPLTIYRGNKIYSYGFNLGTSYQKRYGLSTQSLQGFQSEITLPLNYQVYFNRNNRMSQMDLIPKWGQNISFIYRHVPFEHTMTGTMWAIRTNLYLPGLYSNHGLQLRFSYQKANGRFNNTYDIPMISGYAHIMAPKVENTLLINYRFPLLYPDWSVGSLAYIKRLHGYLFTDYQNIKQSNWQPTSLGIGLSVDLNLFRYKLPDFGLGTKLTYINHPSVHGKIIPSFSFNYNY